MRYNFETGSHERDETGTRIEYKPNFDPKRPFAVLNGTGSATAFRGFYTTLEAARQAYPKAKDLTSGPCQMCGER